MNLILRKKFLSAWKNFFDRSSIRWPDQRTLNALRFMRDHPDQLVQALQTLRTFEPLNDGIAVFCDELLSYPQEILQDPALRVDLNNCLEGQLDLYYTTHPRLQNRAQQKRFLELEVQKQRYYLRLCLRESENFNTAELKAHLSDANLLMSLLYYANSYQISMVSYGSEQLSYTWLDKDHAEMLNGHLQLRFLSETFKEVITPESLYIGSCDVWVLSGIKPMILQLQRLITAIDGQYRSGFMLARELVRNDDFIKSGLAALDAPKNLKHMMLQRLTAFGDTLFQGLVSGGLIRAEIGPITVDGQPIDPCTEGLWLIREMILN